MTWSDAARAAALEARRRHLTSTPGHTVQRSLYAKELKSARWALPRREGEDFKLHNIFVKAKAANAIHRIVTKNWAKSPLSRGSGNTKGRPRSRK